MVSEVVGVRVSFGTRTSSRIDPLGIRLEAGPVYRAAGGSIGWTLDEEAAAKEKGKPVKIKDGKPSQVNHGNVTPSLSDLQRETGRPLAGGVTISHAEQTVVLSLAALRRLRFPEDGADASGERDIAARTTLAALALCAATLAMERGLDLRSRCLLWPDGPTEWELLDVPGKPPTRFSLDHEKGVALLTAVLASAARQRLMWGPPLRLEASPPLVELVKRSQELAVQEAGEEAPTA